MKIKLFVNSFRKGKKMKRFKFTLKNRDYHPCFYGESAEDIIRSILYLKLAEYRHLNIYNVGGG